VTEQRERSDIQALSENWISVTPLKLDLTDDKFGAELSKLL
jgi:broad specificity polyphosphatase/5'/3'-nucleotidase SurE